MSATHVLVALDGSPLADEALAHALDIRDSTVTVLNVVTPLDSSMSEGQIIGSDESRRESAHEHANELVETARRRATEKGKEVETVVETGDPADVILEYVDGHDVDHVVMGGHGGTRSELASRLLGTVATTVLTKAPVTVTVVR